MQYTHPSPPVLHPWNRAHYSSAAGGDFTTSLPSYNTHHPHQHLKPHPTLAAYTTIDPDRNNPSAGYRVILRIPLALADSTAAATTRDEMATDPPVSNMLATPPSEYRPDTLEAMRQRADANRAMGGMRTPWLAHKPEVATVEIYAPGGVTVGDILGAVRGMGRTMERYGALDGGYGGGGGEEGMEGGGWECRVCFNVSGAEPKPVDAGEGGDKE